jgi:Coenzyme PQQ synthesis protein D (PqqD)
MRRRRETPLAVTELTSPPVALPTTVRVPQHVVHREFVAETVVLNLNTGVYHGLNPTGGRMLQLLDEIGDVSVVAARLASEYRRPRSEMASDLEDFCRDLLARDLIEAAPERR